MPIFKSKSKYPNILLYAFSFQSRVYILSQKLGFEAIKKKKKILGFKFYFSLFLFLPFILLTMGKKRIRIVNAKIEPQPQGPSHGSLAPNQSQDTPPPDQTLYPSANQSSALLVPQPQANDNSEESTEIEVQITIIMKLNNYVLL